MGVTEMVFQIEPAKIGSITLDASVQEVHKASAKATRHPVEADPGWPMDVSDHVLVDPISISIQGVISGTPTEAAAAIVALFAGGVLDPVKDAHQIMLDDLLTGRLVTIVTTLLEYPDMVLESVEVTRNAKQGDSLYFSAVATHITQVTLESVAVAPAPSATKLKGKKPPRAASNAESAKAQSAISKFLWGAP